jgi:putative ATP-dependent endonuclease of OLD family
MGGFFKSLGKTVFAVFDKQGAAELAAIKAAVDHLYESQTKGFEDLVLTQTSETALRAYAASVVSTGDWPPHMAGKAPTAATPLKDLQDALRGYFSWAKGSGDAGDLLASCATAADVPEYVRDALHAIANVVEPLPPPPATAASAAHVAAGTAAPAAALASPTAAAVPAPSPALAPTTYAKFLPRPPKPTV